MIQVSDPGSVGRVRTSLVLCLALAACDSGGAPAVDALIPADYATAFAEVRACRQSIDHSPHVRVLANAVAAGPYVRRDVRFPVGSVVVKEEYDDSACTKVTSLTAMRREAPGYDAEAGDWHWQRVRPDLSIVDDGKVTGCRSCHVRCNPGDHGFDFTCAEP